MREKIRHWLGIAPSSTSSTPEDKVFALLKDTISENRKTTKLLAEALEREQNTLDRIVGARFDRQPRMDAAPKEKQPGLFDQQAQSESDAFDDAPFIQSFGENIQ